MTNIDQDLRSALEFFILVPFIPTMHTSPISVNAHGGNSITQEEIIGDMPFAIHCKWDEIDSCSYFSQACN